MAAVVKRTWWSRGPTGRRVRRIAWGYTLQVNGQQERRYDAAWSRQDAEEALAKRRLERDAPPPPPSPKTLGELVTEYLEYKRAKGKRSIRQDEQISRGASGPRRRFPRSPLSGSRNTTASGSRRRRSSGIS